MELSVLKYIPATSVQWLLVLYFFIVLGFVLAITEFARSYFKVPSEITRKYVHVIVGALVVFFSSQTNDPQPIYFLCITFIPINIFIHRFNILPAISSERKSYGTTFFPISILCCLFFFWEGYKFIYYTVILILSFADTAAAIIGQNIKKPVTFKVWYDSKTIQGSTAMFLSSLLIIYFSYLFIPYPDDINLKFPFIFMAIIASVIITISEAISYKGSDNLSIALIAGLILYILVYSDETVQFQFIISVVFVIIFSILSFKFKFLSVDGTIAAAFIAFFVFGIGGLKWTIPILTFFVLSSILSNIRYNIKQNLRSRYEKSSKRDARQVFANGGAALFIVLLYIFMLDEIIYFFYLSVLAAAAADTWATELGVLNKNNPRKITTFKKVEKGVSGAVSLFGTIAAFAGSCSIAFSAYFFIQPKGRIELFAIIAAGILASLVDSFLGATFQAQYITRDNQVTERKLSRESDQNRLISGYRFIDNDIVNFLSILTAPIFFYFLSKVL